MKRCGRCKRRLNGGVFAIAFAIGLLAAFFLPPMCLVVILIIALLILGITCYKH